MNSAKMIFSSLAFTLRPTSPKWPDVWLIMVLSSDPDKSGPCSSLSIKGCWNFGGLAFRSGHADWLWCPLWTPGPPVGSTRCHKGLQGYCPQGRPGALSWNVSDSDPGKWVSPNVAVCLFCRIVWIQTMGRVWIHTTCWHADMLVSDDSQVRKRSSVGSGL